MRWESPCVVSPTTNAISKFIHSAIFIFFFAEPSSNLVKKSIATGVPTSDTVNGVASALTLSAIAAV